MVKQSEVYKIKSFKNNISKLLTKSEKMKNMLNNFLQNRNPSGRKAVYLKSITRPFIYIIAFLLFAFQTKAQDWERSYNYSAYPPEQGGYGSWGNADDDDTYSEHNDCRRFLAVYGSYDESDDTAINIKFRSATLFYYYSDDSTSAHKKLITKSVYHFNKTGGITLIKAYDTLGKISDSTVIAYDKQGNRIRITDYGRTPPSRILEKQNDHFLKWSDKGKLLLDSSIQKKTEVTRWDTSQYSIEKTQSNYDDSGNVVYIRTISNLDTLLYFNHYDGKNRKTSGKTYQYMKWSYDSSRYDKAGFEIFNSTIDNDKDTTTSTWVYDTTGRMLAWYRYRNSKLLETETNVYRPDSSYTKTEERLGDNLGPACPDDRKTVSIYNTHRDCISKIEIQESNGKVFTTTTINSYQYCKIHGKTQILSDSEYVTGKSEWHWDKTLRIVTYKYDARGNETERLEIGGESVNSNSKYTNTYNEQNNVVYHEEYGSCMDKPYTTTTTKYFADGKTVKEERIVEGKSVKISRYGKDSRYMEKLNTDRYSRQQWVWKYEE